MTRMIIQLIAIGIIVFFIYEMLHSSYGGAPFIPMPRWRLRSLIAMANPSTNDIFYDLGCGDGRSLTLAVEEFNVRQAVGYEISRLPLFFASTRVFLSGHKNIKIKKGNIHTADFRDADIIYMFLMPKLMKSMAPVLVREMKSGSRIISASFSIDDNLFPQLKLVKKESIKNIVGYLYIKQ